MMLWSWIQRRIGRSWLITGVGVMLASCGGMTQPNFAHTSPWLTGTITYTAASDESSIEDGTSAPLEGNPLLPASNLCAEVLDGIVQQTQPLYLFGSLDAADPGSTIPASGPLAYVLIDPRDSNEDIIRVFDNENDAVLNVAQTPEQLAAADAKQNYVVDDPSLHYERSSDDQLIARLSATNALEMRVELRLDLVCHPVP
jgi:hypothetical protein